MSTLKTNNIEHLDATSPSIQLGIGGGINVSGVVTATSFVGNVAGNITGNINSSGISTLSNVVVGGATTELVVTGDARITGILTVGTASVTLNGTDGTITGINTINGLTYPSAGPLSNRNLIINGAMQHSQRDTSFTHTTTAQYTLDRFQASNGSSFNWNSAVISQSSDSPEGFANSLKVDVASTSTPTGGQNGLFKYHVEAQDLQQLSFGTSAAKSFTLSFWVKSNKTGTYTVQIYQSDADKYLLSEYSISSSSTWEHKTLTFVGNTADVIDNNNGVGFEVRFNLACGPDDHTTAKATWTAGGGGTIHATSNQVNLFDNTSNEWYMTGVQLEVGERATPFEHRSYGDELAKCQRYYYKLIAAVGDTFANGYNQNSTTTRNILHFPVTMRVAPTALEQTGTAANYRVLHGTTVTACSAVPTLNATTVNTGEVQATTASGLTAGQGNALESNSDGTYLAFTAEL